MQLDRETQSLSESPKVRIECVSGVAIRSEPRFVRSKTGRSMRVRLACRPNQATESKWLY